MARDTDHHLGRHWDVHGVCAVLFWLTSREGLPWRSGGGAVTWDSTVFEYDVQARGHWD